MRKTIQFAVPGVAVVALTMACAMGLPSICVQAAAKKHERTTTMTGRVLAIAGLFSLVELHGDFPQMEAFLFAPESKRKQGRQVPIVVHYLFWENNQKLSESFFDYSALYRLRLQRDPECDETMRSLAYVKIEDESGRHLGDTPVLEPAKGAPVTDPNADFLLECYVLKPGNFQVQK